MTENLAKIVRVLRKEEQGLWIREIHRRTGLNPALVKYYVERNPEMFDVISPQETARKPIVTLVKLKPGALTKPGRVLSRILKETADK